LRRKLFIAGDAGWLFFLAPPAANSWARGDARSGVPVGLLIFTVPLPIFCGPHRDRLQHGSARVADWMFTLSGCRRFATGNDFQLPGMKPASARDAAASIPRWFCSSPACRHMFLRRPGLRAVLVLR